MPGQFNLPKAPPGLVKKAADDPAQMKIRLNQMLYDRRLSQKAGTDTKNETYAPNAEIDRLRKALKGG